MAVAVKAVFFDAGDTLVHLWALKADRFSWLCRQAGITLGADPDLLRQASGAYERHFQNRHIDPDARSPEWYMRGYQAGFHRLGMANAAALSRRVYRVAAELADADVVDPEALHVLARLRAEGLRLAVVSNSNGTLSGRLDALGLAGFFDAIVDSRVVGAEKPDIRIFEIACAATGCSPAEAIHVGDSFGTDVVGAVRAGLHPVLLDALNLYPEPESGGYAYTRVQSLAEVLAAVLALNRRCWRQCLP